MGALRQAWQTVVKYLGQLSGRDRLLIFALMAVAGMALLLVGMTSSRTAYDELLPGATGADVGKMLASLKEGGFEARAEGSRLLVPAGQRAAALAYLQQAGKMPANTSSLFETLLKNQNWMASRADADRSYNAALCQALGEVVAQFRGIESATVMIDAPEAVGLGASYRRPTASVSVTTQAGRELDRDTVDAIAGWVSGAKAGLAMSDVKVIDLRTRRQYSARSADEFGSGAGSDYIERMTHYEKIIREKIVEFVRNDPGATVAVSVQVDNTRQRTSRQEYLPDGKGTVKVVNSERSDTGSSTQGGGSGGAAPGVMSNVPQDLSTGSAGGGGSGSTTEETESTNTVGLGSVRTEVLDPRGMPKRISVLISLSREYVASVAKLKKGAAAGGAGGANPPPGGAAAGGDVTQQEIDAEFDILKKRMETEMTPLIQTQEVPDSASSLPRIVVSMNPLPQPGLILGSGGVQAAGIGGPGGVGGFMGGGGLTTLMNGPLVKNAFLGLLAVVALGMMMMLVRKSSKPQMLPTAEEIVGLPPVIEAGDDVVGEADETQTAMEGIELGESQVKAAKMLEQVEEMVKKNPHDAAGVLNRWLQGER